WPASPSVTLSRSEVIPGAVRLVSRPSFRIHSFMSVRIVCLLLPLATVAVAALPTGSSGQNGKPPAGGDVSSGSLTAQQKERLRERDRYQQESRQLGKQGKLAEATAAWEKATALEREVFGDRHPTVHASLQVLAKLYLTYGDFEPARATRR